MSRIEMTRQSQVLIRGVALISLAAAAAILISAVSSPSVGAVESGGYVFSGFSIERVPSPDGHRRPEFAVGYTIKWDGDLFPGLRTCRFALIASNGSEVAHQVVDIYALDSAGRRAGTYMFRNDGAPSPGRVTVSCEPGRLDDPSGRYNVTNVEVRRAPTSEGDLRTLEATFDTQWLGQGSPGVSECVLEVQDASDQTLFFYSFTLDDAAGMAVDRVMRVIVEEEVVAEPQSAEIVCSPFK